jgi:hypothetical protein
MEKVSHCPWWFETITQGSSGRFSFPITSTFILQVRCKNQFANLGQREKSLSLLFNPKKGPIRQAIKLANTPEVI